MIPKSTQKAATRLVTTLMVIFAMLFTAAVPAHATPGAITPVRDGVALHEPTAAQWADALHRLGIQRAQDPRGFSLRLRMIEDSPQLNAHLAADKRFDVGLQRQFLAVTMPTDVLAALIDLVDSRYLELSVRENADGTTVASVKKASPMIGGGRLGATSVKPLLPQCPSAWAAFWAWWSTNAAFCGAMGFFGPGAALACSFAMAVAGSVIDYNRGC